MEKHVPVLIVGASLGGVAAAIGCARQGVKCCIVEESGWIGGQATAQGVPVDEHPWIEQYGCTRSYRAFREGIRAYYRRNYRLTSAAAADPAFNPGACWVSALGFEPKVGLAVLKEMLQPYQSAGLLEVLHGWRASAAETEHDRVRCVHFESGNRRMIISADYVLDATETGELLPMTGTEYSVGAESVAQTGEPLALDEPDPMRQQPFTHLIAVSFHPDEDHRIEKPEGYEKFSFALKGMLPDELVPEMAKHKMNYLFSPGHTDRYVTTVWNFRRCLCAGNFHGIPSDITMLMNGNEYDKPLLDVPEEQRLKHLEEAKQLSRSLVYYLQNEMAPCYPGIRVRSDVFDTPDGLAQGPYIRESRRIKGVTTVLEQDFRVDQHPEGPVKYRDSVGLGGYRIDIHEKRKDGKTGITLSMHGAHWTQQIPLGALIPVRMENLIPACKNLAVTHVTNGAFRLHPVEWNIGEAAGALAAFALRRSVSPRAVQAEDHLLADFQHMLVRAGVELDWPHQTFGRSYFSHVEHVRDWHFGEAWRLEENR